LLRLATRKHFGYSVTDNVDWNHYSNYIQMLYFLGMARSGVILEKNASVKQKLSVWTNTSFQWLASIHKGLLHYCTFVTCSKHNNQNKSVLFKWSSFLGCFRLYHSKDIIKKWQETPKWMYKWSFFSANTWPLATQWIWSCCQACLRHWW